MATLVQSSMSTDAMSWTLDVHIDFEAFDFYVDVGGHPPPDELLAAQEELRLVGLELMDPRDPGSFDLAGDAVRHYAIPIDPAAPDNPLFPGAL